MIEPLGGVDTMNRVDLNWGSIQVYLQDHWYYFLHISKWKRKTKEKHRCANNWITSSGCRLNYNEINCPCYFLLLLIPSEFFSLWQVQTLKCFFFIKESMTSRSEGLGGGREGGAWIIQLNSQLKLNGWKQTTHQQFIGGEGFEVNWNAIKQTLNRISSLIIDVDWIIIILQKKWRGCGLCDFFECNFFCCKWRLHRHEIRNLIHWLNWLLY